MTKDEIKQLIAEKIAGQGSAIDAASVLPTILDAILDLPAPEPDPQAISSALTIRFSPNIVGTATDVPKDQMCQILGISNDELDKLFAGAYHWFRGGLGDDVDLYYFDGFAIGSAVRLDEVNYVEYNSLKGLYSYSLGN